MNLSFKKSKKHNGLLKLFNFQKIIIIEIIAISFLYVFIGVCGTFYLRFLFDYILIVKSTETLYVISMGFLFLSIFGALINLLRSVMLLFLSQKIDFSSVSKIYMNIFYFPMSIIDRLTTGNITTKITEIQKIRSLIASGSLLLIADVMIGILASILLFIQCPQLLIVLLPLAVFFILIILIFNKMYRVEHNKAMEIHVKLNSILTESLSGIATIKAYNSENSIVNKIELIFTKFVKTVGRAQSLANFQFGSQELITNIAMISILWIGGLQVIKGSITIGQLLAFNALLIFIITPIKKLISVHSIIQAGAVAIERLQLFEETHIIEPEKKLCNNNIKNTIKFVDVDFSYNSESLILSKVNMQINSGDCVALIGESGCGKSTLLKLLLGLYNVQNGQILIDEINILDINLSEFRKTIGYVPQEPVIFHDTLLDNIIFGRTEYEISDVISIAKKLRLHELVEKSSKRFYTILEERGTNLSGGQRQRISVARAMLGSPDLLILDEATSNIDPKTEKFIFDYIADLSSQGTTIIMTTHRLKSIAKMCNKIFLIDQGKVVQQGNHQTLLSEGGKYIELWASQK